MAASMEHLFCSYVYEFLLEKDATLAQVFQKKTKTVTLPKGNPSIGEIMKHYQSTSKKKFNFPTVGKELETENSSSGTEESSHDDEPSKTKSTPQPPAKKVLLINNKQASSSEESSDNSTEEEKYIDVVTSKAVTPIESLNWLFKDEAEESSIDDSFSSDESTAVELPPKTGGPVREKQESSSDDDSYEEKESAGILIYQSNDQSFH